MKGSDGFFLAKRQMQESLDYRIDFLEKERDSLEKTSENVDKHRTLSIRIQELERFRSYIRNAMLWDTDND